MKQITTNDPVVTKSILREELKKELAKYATKDDLKKTLSNYPTKDDLKKELSNYPTKDDLKKELSNYPTTIKVEMMLEKTKMDIDDKARGYRDEILTKMDQVVGELAQLREDRLFEKHEKKEIETRIDNHEKRLKKLEKQTN